MGSSHNGPSRVPHWNPWTMESLTVLSKLLLTSDGSVSSTRMLGPVESGPNAQMDLAANKSQSYLLWKNSLNFFLRFKNGKIIIRSHFERNSKSLTCSSWFERPRFQCPRLILSQGVRQSSWFCSSCWEFRQNISVTRFPRPFHKKIPQDQQLKT